MLSSFFRLRWIDAAGWSATIAAFFINIPAIVSFGGIMPLNDLDFGWRFGVAQAASQRTVFGEGLVFTFGPLSYLYSQFVVPGQRPIYLGLSLLLVLVFTFSVAAASQRNVRWGILLLPVALANQILPDGFFLILPLPLVLITLHSDDNHRLRIFALIVLSAVVGLLPLVKGTMTVPVVVCITLSALVLFRRRERLVGICVIAVALMTTVITWIALGQPFSAFPFYFIRQSYIASGYTDAMSVFGDVEQVYVYLGCAIGLLAAILSSRDAIGLVQAVAITCILFVGFKAGFVRDDGHAMIAGSTLLLVGLIICLNRPNLPRCFTLVMCIAGWAHITGSYVPVNLSSDMVRLTSSAKATGIQLAELIRHPHDFHSRFERAEQSIATASNLPSSRGPSDIYTIQQVDLLASKLPYSPRPILQSYSAYTPELAELNRLHLVDSNAPTTIFFSPTAIDGHYPSLDDGASWPDLLSHYSFRQFAGSFAVLDRSAETGEPKYNPVTTQENASFDQDINIPDSDLLVWARLRFESGMLGHLASIVWKRPILWIDITYQDGHVQRSRLIAGMAEAGFLLSPMVSNAHEFVALRSPVTISPTSRKVKSFRIGQDGSSLWGDHFLVSLSTLSLPPDSGAPPIMSAVDDAPLYTIVKGGDCSIDMVGSTENTSHRLIASGRYLNVVGWGYARADEGLESNALRVAVVDANRSVRYFPSERDRRPDLDAHFSAPKPTSSGFHATLDLDGMKPPFELSIIQDTRDGERLCSAAPVRVLRADFE